MSEIKRGRSVLIKVGVFFSITVLSFGKVNGLAPFSYAFFYGAVVGSNNLFVGVIALLLTAFYDGIGYIELILTVLSLVPFCYELAYNKASKKCSKGHCWSTV